jgi:hypothetical protein
LQKLTLLLLTVLFYIQPKTSGKFIRLANVSFLFYTGSNLPFYNHWISVNIYQFAYIKADT